MLVLNFDEEIGNIFVNCLGEVKIEKLLEILLLLVVILLFFLLVEEEFGFLFLFFDRLIFFDWKLFLLLLLVLFLFLMDCILLIILIIFLRLSCFRISLVWCKYFFWGLFGNFVCSVFIFFNKVLFCIEYFMYVIVIMVFWMVMNLWNIKCVCVCVNFIRFFNNLMVVCVVLWRLVCCW